VKALPTALDLIVRAFKTDAIDQLPPKLQEELSRWSMADDLLRQYKDSKTILGILQAKFKISLATAYRDIENAKRLFGTLNVSDKDYYQAVYAEELEEVAKLAKMRGDLKTATQAIKEAAEIRGIKDGNEMRDLYADLEPSKFVLQINIIGGEQRSMEIDFDTLEEVEDAVYEDVTKTINDVPAVSEAQMEKMLDAKN
jgi:hypothetical protein